MQEHWSRDAVLLDLAQALKTVSPPARLKSQVMSASPYHLNPNLAKVGKGDFAYPPHAVILSSGRRAALSRRRADPELVQHAQSVPVEPVLGDLAVYNAENTDARDLHGLSRRGHTP